MSRSVRYREYKLNALKNPDEARVYLEVAFEEYRKDGNREAFLIALRDIAEVQGSMPQVSEALSKQEDLEVDALDAVLHTRGFRLSVEPIDLPIQHLGSDR